MSKGLHGCCPMLRFDTHAELVVHTLHSHYVVVRLHDAHAPCSSHRLFQDGVPVRLGGRQHWQQTPGEHALAGVVPASEATALVRTEGGNTRDDKGRLCMRSCLAGMRHLHYGYSIKWSNQYRT